LTANGATETPVATHDEAVAVAAPAPVPPSQIAELPPVSKSEVSSLAHDQSAATHAADDMPVRDTLPNQAADHRAGIAVLLAAAKNATVALPIVSAIAQRGPSTAKTQDHSAGIETLLMVASAAALTATARAGKTADEKPHEKAEQREHSEAATRPVEVDQTADVTTRPQYFDASTNQVLVSDQRSEIGSGETWPRRILRYTGWALAGYAALMLALLVLFRFVNPPGSALMAWRAVGGTEISRTWVPIENISPNLVRAVIVSEDWIFCDHRGVDMAAMQEAIEKAGDGIPRGASTISMQVVKNVFLWPSKSYLRKAIEVLWPKRRVLEVYLNIAEWGPGIFGAESAARHHFNKSASKLTSREAAQLAAALPNPFVRDAGDPGPRLARKATTIQNRMRIAAGVTDCVGVASDARAP
jgi:monofunctional biosynthetic peptidoglycan transglycosylase